MSFDLTVARLVELREEGDTEACFRVRWRGPKHRREYQLDIVRGDGVIERGIWPAPIGGQSTLVDVLTESEALAPSDALEGKAEPFEELVRLFRERQARRKSTGP